MDTTIINKNDPFQFLLVNQIQILKSILVNNVYDNVPLNAMYW